MKTRDRPTSWWLQALRTRAATMYGHPIDFSQPIVFNSPAEQEACVRFFNAALRSEESGSNQAHDLADEVRKWDPELAECLVLYGKEETWHRELLLELMPKIGGEIRRMGKVTGTFYHVYAQAKHIETITLTNLMFETIGAQTYRMALARIDQGPRFATIRQMLAVLARDESFHVPLNVHFMRRVWQRTGAVRRLKMRGVYHLMYLALIGSAYASRKVAFAFDGIPFAELAGAYSSGLGRLFLSEPEFGLAPNPLVVRAFGSTVKELTQSGVEPAISVAAAEAAVDRSNVQVTLQ